MKLTDKQERFCNEYLIDLNATQAAIRAGYSENTANEQGARLLANVSVQAFLSDRKKAISEKFEITHEQVLREYYKLGFYDIRNAFDEVGNLIPVKDLDDTTAAAIAGIDVFEENVGTGENKKIIGYTKKIRLSGKREALDSICKMLGYNAVEKKDITSGGEKLEIVLKLNKADLESDSIE